MLLWRWIILIKRTYIYRFKNTNVCALWRWHRYSVKKRVKKKKSLLIFISWQQTYTHKLNVNNTLCRTYKTVSFPRAKTCIEKNAVRYNNGIKNHDKNMILRFNLEGRSVGNMRTQPRTTRLSRVINDCHCIWFSILNV